MNSFNPEARLREKISEKNRKVLSLGHLTLPALPGNSSMQMYTRAHTLTQHMHLHTGTHTNSQAYAPTHMHTHRHMHLLTCAHTQAYAFTHTHTLTAYAFSHMHTQHCFVYRRKGSHLPACSPVLFACNCRHLNRSERRHQNVSQQNYFMMDMTLLLAFLQLALLVMSWCWVRCSVLQKESGQSAQD